MAMTARSRKLCRVAPFNYILVFSTEIWLSYQLLFDGSGIWNAKHLYLYTNTNKYEFESIIIYLTVLDVNFEIRTLLCLYNTDELTILSINFEYVFFCLCSCSLNGLNNSKNSHNIFYIIKKIHINLKAYYTYLMQKSNDNKLRISVSTNQRPSHVYRISNRYYWDVSR